MLGPTNRKSGNTTLQKSIGSSLTAVFLTENQKNKSRIKNRSGIHYNRSYKYHGSNSNAFNFEENILSILEWMASQLTQIPPTIIIIISVFAVIAVIYLLLAIFTTSMIAQSSSNSVKSKILTEKEKLQNIEMDELIQKLLQIRREGNMMDFEEFLHPMMEKHCLKLLPPKFLSTHALESFHMNLAAIVSYVAKQNKLFNFDAGLRITAEGGIIDSEKSNVAEYLKKGSKPCLLLDRLHAIAISAKTSDSKSIGPENKAKDTINENDSSSRLIKHASKLEKMPENMKTESDIDQFAQTFDWSTPALFVELIISLMKRKCPQLLNVFSVEQQKEFILNFFEICDQLGTRIATSKGSDTDSKSNLNSSDAELLDNKHKKEFIWYMIGKDAHLYSVDQEMYFEANENNEYMKCTPLMYILNQDIELDERFQMTNIQIVVENYFKKLTQKPNKLL